MKFYTVFAVAAAATGALLAGCDDQQADAAHHLAENSAKETKPPFSGQANKAYGDALWSALKDAKLVGDSAITSHPYKGNAPHGATLDYLETDLTLEGHTGVVLVKKNYRSDNLEGDALNKAVLNDPKKHLASITVMYKRESGYDPDNQNWFWAKYLPDGSYDKNPKGMDLVGRVAKGAPQGCIACHKAAPGGDMVFTHDRLSK